MATRSDHPEIAVAGSGIAGLTTAICLARQGFSVLLCEKARSFSEIGAGIQLSPNAIHVLRRLGLDKSVETVAVEPEAIDLRNARNGKLLTSIPLLNVCTERYGAPYLVAHRADLLQVLLNAAAAEHNIALHTEAEIGSVQPAADHVGFTIAGRHHRAELLIAADGVHSSIRRDLTGGLAQDLGRTAWRASLADVEIDPAVNLRTGLWLGNSVHLVHYPLRRACDINLVLIGNSDASAPHFLLAQFAPALRALVAGATWKPWPLKQVDPAGRWCIGRVALIGDAAHAMLPTAAQGGAQALEDAFVLAHCLSAGRDDFQRALQDWQAMRKPRVRRIARQADFNLGVYGMSGATAAARNLVLQMIPGHRHLARLDWLYGWQPPG